MFSGLMPALVTPFDEAGEIDLAAAEAVIDRHVAAGVSGVVALGSTGEFSHLTTSERLRFAEEVVGLAAGRVPVIIGTGASGTREALSIARHAAESGADAVVTVSPFYWTVGEEALFRHFAAIAEAVSIPTLVYNFPMLTGIDLSPALVGRLAEECPNVVGIKDTVLKYIHTVHVIQAVKEVRPEFAVLSGFEDQILPNLLAGGDGSICGLANVAPELFVNLVEAAQSGDFERATDLHRRVLRLMDLGALSDPPIGAIKAAMAKLGVKISPHVRGPALPAPPESEAAIETLLRETGLLTVSGEA